jgi:hypothetical protein
MIMLRRIYCTKLLNKEVNTQKKMYGTDGTSI